MDNNEFWATVKKSLKANIASNETENSETRSQRFQDFDQLKYSLRSVAENAPWFRNIYIVTNGQVPVWLNTSNPRVRIVIHNEIFEYKEHLPTFSSRNWSQSPVPTQIRRYGWFGPYKSAIETHLHRISNMTNRWVYMNDDWAFTQKTCFQDFFANDATRIYTINSWVCFWPLLSQSFDHNQIVSLLFVTFYYLKLVINTNGLHIRHQHRWLSDN